MQSAKTKKFQHTKYTIKFADRMKSKANDQRWPTQQDSDKANVLHVILGKSLSADRPTAHTTQHHHTEDLFIIVIVA